MQVRKSDSTLNTKDQFLITLNTIGDGVLSLYPDGSIILINESALRILGLDSGLENLDLSLEFTIENSLRQMSFQNMIEECRGKNSPVTYDNLFLQNKEGIKLFLEILISPIKHDHEEIHGYVFVLKNVTNTHLMSEKLKWQARHDSLTGILNRRAFEGELNRTLKSARNKNSDNVMLYLDLDQFKIINDICGHMAGDELLKTLSSKISILLDDNSTLARLGGDEFGIILESCSLENANSIANQILNLIKSYEFHWGKKNYKIGVSIGMVPIYANSISIAHIMSMADIACYTAKDLGRNRIHLYVGGEIEYMTRHGEMQWVSHIKKALQENSFVLYTQDIIPVDPSKNLKAHKEILLRMKGEDDELYFPADFITAAERYNIIQEIDRWVIYNTFRSVAQKNKTGKDTNVVYSINLSGSSINDSTLSIFIGDSLHEFGLIASNFCFEITETTAVASFAYAREFIREMKMAGFEFALDDFGSGLSSFNYLKNLPVDVLKIDGHFVKNMHTNFIDHAMVEAINNIGHTLNIRTVAEYVENEHIFEKLKKIGVDYVQGFSIAKPKPFI